MPQRFRFPFLLLGAALLLARADAGSKEEHLEGRIVAIDAEGRSLTLLPDEAKAGEIRVTWGEKTKFLWSAEPAADSAQRRKKLTAQGGTVQPPGSRLDTGGLKPPEPRPAAASDLALKLEIEVKGVRGEDGVLAATRIEIESGKPEPAAAASPSPAPTPAEKK